MSTGVSGDSVDVGDVTVFRRGLMMEGKKDRRPEVGGAPLSASRPSEKPAAWSGHDDRRPASNQPSGFGEGGEGLRRSASQVKWTQAS